MKEKPFQSVGATVLPDTSASEVCGRHGHRISGLGTPRGHDQMRSRIERHRIAELLQERRRPRRTIVEHSSKGSQRSNGVMENAHHHPEGLLRTMSSDLMETTGVDVNVKVWLVRHCSWSLTRFAIGADRHTAFKRQRGRMQTRTKVGGRRCSWESWICLMK